MEPPWANVRLAGKGTDPGGPSAAATLVFRVGMCHWHAQGEGGCPPAAGVPQGCSRGAGRSGTRGCCGWQRLDSPGQAPQQLFQPGAVGVPKPFSPLPAPLHTVAGNKRNAKRRRSPGKKGKKKKKQKPKRESGQQEKREGGSLKIPRSWQVSEYQQLFPKHKINTVETHALCKPAPRSPC